MLYLLLMIIAVGVLLASEEGKRLLELLLKIAGIGAILYVCYHIIVLVVAILVAIVESETFRNYQNSVSNVLGAIISSVITIAIVVLPIKRYKDFRSKKIPYFFENKFTKICFIFFGVFILLMAILVAYIHFSGFGK